MSNVDGLIAEAQGFYKNFQNSRAGFGDRHPWTVISRILEPLRKASEQSGKSFGLEVLDAAQSADAVKAGMINALRADAIRDLAYSGLNFNRYYVQSIAQLTTGKWGMSEKLDGFTDEQALYPEKTTEEARQAIANILVAHARSEYQDIVAHRHGKGVQDIPYSVVAQLKKAEELTGKKISARRLDYKHSATETTQTLVGMLLEGAKVHYGKVIAHPQVAKGKAEDALVTGSEDNRLIPNLHNLLEYVDTASYVSRRKISFDHVKEGATQELTATLKQEPQKVLSKEWVENLKTKWGLNL